MERPVLLFWILWKKFERLYSRYLNNYIDTMERKMQKTFLLVLIISLAVMLVSVILHNLLSALFKKEEAVFFIIAVFISPIGILVGALGVIVLGIKSLFSKKPARIKRSRKKRP